MFGLFGKKSEKKEEKRKIIPPIARQGDVIVYVEQNNQNKTLLIQDVYDETGLVARELGVAQTDLEKTDFRDWLPERVKKAIAEFLDFDDLGNDLVFVLQRMKDFAIRSPAGVESPMRVRVQRDVSLTQDTRYAVILNSPQQEKKYQPQELTRALEEAEKDKSTGIYNRMGFKALWATTQVLIKEKKLTSTFIMIKLKQYPQIVRSKGSEAALSIINELISSCALTFRHEDVMGYLDDGRLGIMLMHADVENSPIPLNRLRWNIKRLPYFSLPSDKLPQAMKIACIQMQGLLTLEGALEFCETKIAEGSPDELIYLVPRHEE